jgi:hypothetical protein
MIWRDVTTNNNNPLQMKISQKKNATQSLRFCCPVVRYYTKSRRRRRQKIKTKHVHLQISFFFWGCCCRRRPLNFLTIVRVLFRNAYRRQRQPSKGRRRTSHVCLWNRPTRLHIRLIGWRSRQLSFSDDFHPTNLFTISRKETRLSDEDSSRLFFLIPTHLISGWQQKTIKKEERISFCVFNSVFTFFR